MSKDRLDEISQLFIEFASGNLDAKANITDNSDELDAIIAGIHMLGEELKHSTVSRDYLNSIYKGIVDMLFVLNPEGIIQKVNDPVIKLLKYKENEIIGQPFDFLLNQKSSLKNIIRALIKEGYCYNIEKILRTKKNEKIPVSFSASLLYDKQEKISGILFIAKDISEIKKTEEELILKNKELDTFIYKVAHDLKGPLSSILGLANVAGIDVKDKEALKYFTLIKQCTIRLEKILINLREIAEIDKINQKKEKVDISDIINKVLLEIKKNFYYTPEATFDIEIKQTKKVYCNSKILYNIIFQILENAFKFKDKNKKTQIYIYAAHTKKSIQIIIQDNGTGIKKIYHKKIFDMFFRANTVIEGNGLGLYSVKTSIKRLGGTIQIKSKEGEGSKFIISFPVN